MSNAINRPLKFAPYYKQVIWGGDRIAKYKHADIPLDHVGESWEISPVAGHLSVVVDDPEHAGKNINQLVDEFGQDFLGTRVIELYGMRFPLLIKVIDACGNLSVQVHPDDALAMKRHHTPGKTEMWYVLDTQAGAKIYCGLAAPLDADKFAQSAADGSIMDYVGEHDSAPRQFYFVPAGTIHAIGAGNLIAEIQEASDITYRIYDYNRKDADGRPRQLHIAEARDAINYNYPDQPKPMAEVFPQTKHDAVHCSNFAVDYVRLGDADEPYRVDTHGRSFAIIMATEGDIEVQCSSGLTGYPAGSTVLLPACVGSFALSGRGTALLIHC